jgi:hypothetical protein
MIHHECQNSGVWFFSWNMHSQIRLFRKLIILLTAFSIHQNFNKLEIPSGIWNGFGLKWTSIRHWRGDLKRRLKKKLIFCLGFIFKIYFLIKNVDVALTVYKKFGQNGDGETDLEFANTQMFKIQN